MSTALGGRRVSYHAADRSASPHCVFLEGSGTDSIPQNPLYQRDRHLKKNIFPALSTADRPSRVVLVALGAKRTCDNPLTHREPTRHSRPPAKTGGDSGPAHLGCLPIFPALKRQQRGIPTSLCACRLRNAARNHVVHLAHQSWRSSSPRMAYKDPAFSFFGQIVELQSKIVELRWGGRLLPKAEEQPERGRDGKNR